MASVNKLSIGSSGDDVVKLQEALIAAGYDVGSTGADGKFGTNTYNAVKKYQQDNGLTVDGIAGKNTQGALYNSGSNKSTTPTTTPTTTPSNTTEVEPFTYDDFTYDKEFSYGDFSYDDFSYSDYEESDTVKQANALLQQHNASKPGAYQSQWQEKINDYMSQIENRDPFSYDFNADALYQQYKDQYIQQGKMAMMDTMGQAAAMTGGYGNSYAQSVGQQAYNQQLSQLNNIMPELYQMAYDRYNQEGQDLLNMYNMYMGREEQDYGRYMDGLNTWLSERDYLTGRYDSERDFDYSMWDSDRNFSYNQYTSDRNLAYDQYATDKNLAYDEFTADRNLAYDIYQTGRNEAFQNYQTNLNQTFTANENEKDRQHTADENQKKRDFQSTENQKDRAAKAANAAANSSYGTLNTEDTMTWIKKFEGAENLEQLDEYTTALQGIIGPEAAAIWYDTYSGKFKDDDDDDICPKCGKVKSACVCGNKGGGGGGGVNYNMAQ